MRRFCLADASGWCHFAQQHHTIRTLPFSGLFKPPCKRYNTAAIPARHEDSSGHQAVFLSTTLAHGYWAAAYVVAAATVLFLLRRRGSTDIIAAMLDNGTSAAGGEAASRPRTLPGAVLSFLRMPGASLLLAVGAMTWTVRLGLGGWCWLDAWVALGLLAFWPLQEWLVHALLLHLKPFTLFGRPIEPILVRSHRNHHLRPTSPELGITPLFILWLYVAGVPVVWLLMAPPAQALTGTALFFSLALNYEWVHYLIHTPYVPRTRLYRRLWRNHRLHHYKNEHYWFGVTMLAGDRLLQTWPSGDVPRSETCRMLDGAASEIYPSVSATPLPAHATGSGAVIVSGVPRVG